MPRNLDRSLSGILFLGFVNLVANDERAKGPRMIDYSEYLEGYRDAQAYDLEEGGYDADYPLTVQLAEVSSLT